MELMLVIHSQIQISVKLLAPLLITILVCNVLLFAAEKDAFTTKFSQNVCSYKS